MSVLTCTIRVGARRDPTIVKGWSYEADTGVNLLTPKYRTREKRPSTAFNFGEHLAIDCRRGSFIAESR